MNTSDRFLRFAAECEVMAKFSRTPENRAVWNGLAERWVRCAKLMDHKDFRILQPPLPEASSKGHLQFCALTKSRQSRSGTFRIYPLAVGFIHQSDSRLSPLAPFPLHRRPSSHVPYESLVELHAAYMPDAVRAVSGGDCGKACQ